MKRLGSGSLFFACTRGSIRPNLSHFLLLVVLWRERLASGLLRKMEPLALTLCLVGAGAGQVPAPGCLLVGILVLPKRNAPAEMHIALWTLKPLLVLSGAIPAGGDVLDGPVKGEVLVIPRFDHYRLPEK